MTAPGQPSDASAEFSTVAERGLTTPRAAGVAGIVFAVLFVLALLLLRQAVGMDLDNETVLHNISGTGLASDLALAGLYAVPFAGIAFLWFIGVVRDRVGAREDRFFATVFLGSGLLFVAMLFASTAVLAGLIAGNRYGTAAPTDVATVGFARSVGYSFLFVYASKMAGVFTLVMCTIIRRLGWPRWTYLSGFATATLLILSISFFEPIVVLFAAWVAAISLYVLVVGDQASRAGDGS
jgi:hypothetical protein